MWLFFRGWASLFLRKLSLVCLAEQDREDVMLQTQDKAADNTTTLAWPETQNFE